MEKTVKCIMLCGLTAVISVKRLVMPRGTCRFQPSCSQYAADAIRKKPVMCAILMIIKRIFRCNPFSGFGYDPVIDLHKEDRVK